MLVGGTVFLFAALRITSQPAEAARSASVDVVDVVQTAAEAPVAAPVTVAPGDSLSSIAQRNGTTAEAVQGINNLPDSFLRVNQRLVLP